MYEAIRRELLARTPLIRVPHVLGVEGMSVVLATRWGLDVERCLLAALLHDLAKPFPKEVQREKIDRVTVFPVTDEDRRFPKVWHGMVAAQEAHDVYGVRDDEVLEAIAYHSTGRRALRPVGLVIYVSDFIEPSRNWPGVEAARAELLTLEMHDAARRVAHYKLERLAAEAKPAHRLTNEMADWLDSLKEKNP